jgi:hypothetical protein
LLYLLPVGFLVAAFSLILFITAEAIVIVDGQGQVVPVDELLTILLITLGIMLFFGLLSYVALIRPLRRYRLRRVTWVKAKAIWDELYYCYHCDTVFNPADPLWAAVPASQMNELLG